MISAFDTDLKLVEGQLLEIAHANQLADSQLADKYSQESCEIVADSEVKLFTHRQRDTETEPCHSI